MRLAAFAFVEIAFLFLAFMYERERIRSKRYRSRLMYHHVLRGSDAQHPCQVCAEHDALALLDWRSR